jgi:class 3 adenylate cyclase
LRDLPRGTVTFLFTDVEGSTRLLKQLGEGYADVLAEHQRLLRDAFESAGGQEVDTQGDSFFFAFPRAKDAVQAAMTGQRTLAEHTWPPRASVRVRMGLHTGEPTVGEERYTGMGVHKAARIASAAHGGQILLSNTTRGLVEDDLPQEIRLVDLGEHRLKDIDAPERIFQLNAPGLSHRFATLRTDAPLPQARWRPAARISRERALIAVAAALIIAAIVVGIAVAIGRHETNGEVGGGTASKAAGPFTAPGGDPSTIVPGRSIGAVRLGMTESEVEALYGDGIETQWLAKGRNGSRRTYSGPGGALVVSFYDGKVVQVSTTNSYYATANGVHVGALAPLDSSQLEAALRRGEVEEIEPGVYAWRGFVFDNHTNSYCLRGENAATQLIFRPYAAHLSSVFITDARLLAYLPAHITGPTGAISPNDVFCAAQPLGR